METGLNFKTRKVEVMENYETLTYHFDYEHDFLDQHLEQGARNLEFFFTKIVERLEAGKNYDIHVLINNEEFLEFDEYFTLFSTFAFCLTKSQGIDNKQGYLKVKEEMLKQITITDYAMLKIMNNDYPYGTIQMSIEDGKETIVKWTNLRDQS